MRFFKVYFVLFGAQIRQEILIMYDLSETFFLTIGRKFRWRKHADEKASEEEIELRTPQDVCVYCHLCPTIAFDVEIPKIYYRN